MSNFLRACKFCGAPLSQTYRFVICIDCRRESVARFKNKHADMKPKPAHIRILNAFTTLSRNPAETWEIKVGLTDGGFQHGIRKLVEQGLVRHLRRGYYELTEKGRSKLNVQAR